ncbi:MAG: hypothetical protein NUW12_11975 [Firmicutes bacterium]|nr:hypothetical protein [Bacillota bacterium]
MEIAVTVAYYVMTAAIAALLACNFLKTKDVQKMVLYLVVLTPFMLRVLRIK